MKTFIMIILFVSVNKIYAQALLDPTRPSPSKTVQNAGATLKDSEDSSLRVSAILINKLSKQAIINGRGFTEGQYVSGYKIISIGNNQVILDGTDGKQTLFVNNNNLKKDSNNGF